MSRAASMSIMEDSKASRMNISILKSYKRKAIRRLNGLKNKYKSQKMHQITKMMAGSSKKQIPNDDNNLSSLSIDERLNFIEKKQKRLTKMMVQKSLKENKMSDFEDSENILKDNFFKNFGNDSEKKVSIHEDFISPGMGKRVGSAGKKNWEKVKKSFSIVSGKNRVSRMTSYDPLHELSEKRMRVKQNRLMKNFKKLNKKIDTTQGKMTYELYLHSIHPQSRVTKPKNENQEKNKKDLEQRRKIQDRLRLKHRGDYLQKCIFRNNSTLGPLGFINEKNKVKQL